MTRYEDEQQLEKEEVDPETLASYKASREIYQTIRDALDKYQREKVESGGRLDAGDLLNSVLVLYSQMVAETVEYVDKQYGREKAKEELSDWLEAVDDQKEFTRSVVEEYFSSKFITSSSQAPAEH
jgi:hypothetical protein